eukprot:gb/GECH01005645.1/.p1 GENE.gb/GECH01005645.1/~~gb/GECH01005645.1/.p1  ORF type:complete len:472 (+),score=65.79 gb/GECH01005645.1/:1-1416(+)
MPQQHVISGIKKSSKLKNKTRTRTRSRCRTRTRSTANRDNRKHNNNMPSDSVLANTIKHHSSRINRMQGALNSGSSQDVPVVGREDLRRRLRRAVWTAVDEGCGGRAVIVTGSPGTGKTLCVQHVLAEEQHGGDHDPVPENPTPTHHPSLPWTYVNCMALSRLGDVYGRVCGNHHIRDDNDDFMTHLSEGQYRVAVVDEVERLGAQRIPRLLAACTHPRSRVILVAISNAPAIAHTCTAATRQPHRITTLCFERYSAAELAAIVRSRLSSLDDGREQGEGGVQSAAVELVCRKIAASTGDARAALEMVSRAVEGNTTRTDLEEEEAGTQEEIGVRQMGGVVRDVLGGRDAAAIRGLPHTQKVLLCAAVKLLMHERTRFDVRRLRQYYVTLCDEHSLPRLSSREVMDMCEGLCAQGIVSLESRGKGSSSMRRMPLTFNMSASDMARVLRDDNGVLSRILDGPWHGPKTLVNL